MRRRFLRALVSGVAALYSSLAHAQAARIPTFCDVTAAQKEVQAGARVTFTLSLKIMSNRLVAATADATVTLTSADVVVLLVTEDGVLATADRDLPLELSTRVGQIE